MSKIISKVIAAVLPERCPYCNKIVRQGDIACKKCKSKFPEINLESYASGCYICYSCFFYEDIFAKAIKRFKFLNYPQSAKKLAIPLADTIKKYDVNFDCITYVPMFPKRERDRGYNQSQLLAKEVSKILDIPLEDFLIKIKDNPPQHTMDTKDKKKNVKGVFAVQKKDKLKGKNILIIDDVITSGYTLGECCKLLSKGKARVFCATVCNATKVI